jgi:predicted secreted hydrolase
VQGRAWLDHEWSDTLLAPGAQGWDWIGFNLADGSALTAFQIRPQPGAAGSAARPLWAGGSWRAAGQAPRDLGPAEVRFEPLRWWTSRASGARYPVAWRVTTPVGRWEVRALLDAQELDSSASTGAIYWEGLSALLDEAGRRVGLGYLEMTGYARPLRLSSHNFGGERAAQA